MADSSKARSKSKNVPRKTKAKLIKPSPNFDLMQVPGLDALQVELARCGLLECVKALKTSGLPAMQILREALELSGSVVEADARQLPAHLVGRLVGHSDAGLRKLIEQAQSWRGSPWLCPAGPTLQTPGGPLLHTLKEHGDFIGSMVILPGGETLVSASEDGTIRVWNLERGKQLRVLDDHTSCVNIIKLTPDGKYLLSGSDDATIKVWDITTWQVLKTWEGHQGYVRDIAITTDGRVVSCSQDGTVKVWKLADGELLYTFEGHEIWVNAVAATPDNRMAISSSVNNDLWAWDLEKRVELPPFFQAKGRELTQFLVGDVFFNVKNDGPVGHQNYAVRLAVTPDGQKLVSVGDEIIIWDIATRAQLERFSIHGSSIAAIALLDDGRTGVTGAESVKVWDVENHQVSLTLTGHAGAVKSVCGNERYLVSGSEDKTIKVWDRACAAHGQGYEGHARSATRVTLSPDERLALSSSYDGTAKVWELASGRCLHTLMGHRSGFVDVGAFTPDSKRAITTTHGGQVRVWDAASGALVLDMQHPTDKDFWIDAFAVTPDGNWGLAGAVGRGMTLWNLREGGDPQMFEGSEHQITDIAITADGRRAVSAAYGKRDDKSALQGWDIASRQLLWELWPRPAKEGKAYFSCVRLMPGDTRLVAGTSHGQVYIVDVESGAELAVWQAHPVYISRVFLYPDGRLVTGAREDERLVLRIWDVATQQNVRTLSSSRLKPREPHLAADGHYAVTAAQATVILWDLEADKEQAMFVGDSDIIGLAVTSSGHTIIAGEEAGRVHVLRLMA